MPKEQPSSEIAWNETTLAALPGVQSRQESGFTLFFSEKYSGIQPSVIPPGIPERMEILKNKPLKTALLEQIGSTFPQIRTIFETWSGGHNPGPENIAVLGEALTTPEFQTITVAFNEVIKASFVDPNQYSSACAAAETEGIPETDTLLKDVFSRLEPVITLGSPGHDPHHIFRDTLQAAIFAQTTGFRFTQADIAAGTLAAALHDSLVGLFPRYQEQKYGAGHAQITAMVYYLVAPGSGGESLKRLTAYAIAAHVHELKAVSVNQPDGYTRGTYPHELCIKDNQWYGLAPLLTKLADRGDQIDGVFFLRSVMAWFDLVNETGQAADRETVNDGDRFIEVYHTLGERQNNAFDLTHPKGGVNHLKMFLTNKFDATTPYNVFDAVFASAEELAQMKKRWSEEFIALVAGEKESDPTDYPAFADAARFIRQVSGALPERLDPALNTIAWQFARLPEAIQRRWLSAFTAAKRHYQERMRWYEQRLPQGNVYTDLLAILKQTD